MRETIMSPSNYPARVGFLRPEQIAQRSTWGVVKDSEMSSAAMHVIRVVPARSTTVTTVNPLDPACCAEGENSDWHEPPAGYGYVGQLRPVWWNNQ